MRTGFSACVAALLVCGGALADDGPATTGRVYVYRPSDEVEIVLPVWVDGQRVNPVIEHGSCIFFDLPSGPHRIHAMSENDANIDLKAGDAVYVMLDGRTQHIVVGGTDGGYLDQVTPRVVSTSEGKDHAGDCKPADRP